MGFVMSVSVAIAVVLIANSRAASIYTAETSKERTENRLLAIGGLVLIIQDCLVLERRNDPIEFKLWPNMTRTEKCFMGCVFKKAGLLSKDNKIITNGAQQWIELLSEGKITSKGHKSDGSACTDDEIYNKCSNVTDEDVCEATFKIINCSEQACQDNESKKLKAG